MRTTRTMRAPGAINVAAGALILAVPASALALTTGPDHAALAATDARPNAVQVHLNRTQVAYDRQIDVDGHLAAAAAGRRLSLQFQPAGSNSWRTLSTAAVARSGSFEFRATLTRTGRIRVAGAPWTAAPGRHSGELPSTVTSVEPSLSPSPAQRVVVGSSLKLHSRTRSVLAGRALAIDGQLLPGTAGRRVRLMTRTAGHWTTVSQTKTGPRGGFRLRDTVKATGRHSLRVSFAGDRQNRATSAWAGELVGMRYSVASWYYDAGNTACGFHAVDGVANRWLRCGTKVTFAYRGRTVVATVDDRGPYVGGRDYDLSQTTAAALGMVGVVTMESSI